MSFPINYGLLLTALVVLAKTTAFVFVAAPFALPVIPRSVKVALALALALAGAKAVGSLGPLSSSALVGEIFMQLMTGAVVGFVVNVFFNIGISAGSEVGLFGGFSAPPSIDPLSYNQVPPTGQLFGMIWATLFFTSGADLLTLHGLLQFDTTAVMSHPELGMVVVLKSISTLMGAALQIAAPILAILFLTQVLVGVLTKVAPTLNPFSFAFPVQIVLSLALMSVSVLMLPNILAGAVHYILAAEHDLMAGA